MTDDEILSRRYWLIENVDWLMAEVNFHKEHQDIYGNSRIDVWDLDEPEGCTIIQ